MNAMTPQRFAVRLTPLPTAARVAKQRKAWKIHAIFATLGLGVILALWVGPLKSWVVGWPPWALATMAMLWAMGTAVRMGITIWALARAQRDLRSIDHGDALYIDPMGIHFLHPKPVSATWPDITALKIAGSSLGAGPELIMEVRGQVAARIPLSFLDAMPAAIDSAVVARSMGRIRVDVSAMDKMI